MSYTSGYAAYAEFQASGFQKFINAVYAARPHYFNYATPALGGGSSVDVTALTPLPVPGSNTSIDFTLSLGSPALSFPSQQQFQIAITVTVSFAQKGSSTLLTGSFSVAATGSVASQRVGQKTNVSLVINAVTVTGVGSLAPLVQYMLELILNSLLGNLAISASSFVQGALTISIAKGPQIGTNPPAGSYALQIWANLT
jgi:hypothetical protein